MGRDRPRFFGAHDRRRGPIVTKILAGRPKDLDDVRGILAAQGATLNADAVREMLSMLEEALGVSDLLPIFESLTT